MTNREFIRNWMRNPTKDGKHEHLSVRGGVLFSYEMRIAAIDSMDCILRRRGPSPTTNRHIFYVRCLWEGNIIEVAAL